MSKKAIALIVFVWFIVISCSSSIVQNFQSVSALTCSSSNTSSKGSVREWLIMLKDESIELEKSAKMIQKSIDISNTFGKDGLFVVSRRESQLKKVKQALETIYQEIKNIESKCSSNIGPDCDGIINCDESKCSKCSSITGQCLTCFGNWNGPTCSECKIGWTGENCSIPVCNSKCSNCSSPNNCSVCSGNWNEPTCSDCKIGWKGENCNTPICDSKCAVCSFPNNCIVCYGNWNGVNC